MTKEDVEREYLTFCRAVGQAAMKIAGECGAGYTDDAGNAAAALAQLALTQEQQYCMKQETATDGYDLRSLPRPSDTATDTEAGGA